MKAHILAVDDDAVSEALCDGVRSRGLSVNAVSDDRSGYKRIVPIPAIDDLAVDLRPRCCTSGAALRDVARQVAAGRTSRWTSPIHPGLVRDRWREGDAADAVDRAQRKRT